MFAYVYTSLPKYTTVHLYLLMFTAVISACLPMFTYVYLGILVFT